MAKKIDGLVKEAKEKTNEIIQKLGSDGGFSIQPEQKKQKRRRWKWMPFDYDPKQQSKQPKPKSKKELKGRKRQTTDVKVKKAVTCIINFITLIEKKEKVAVLKYKAAEKMKYEKAAQLRTRNLIMTKK